MFIKLRNSSGGNHAYRIQNNSNIYIVESYNKTNGILNSTMNKNELYLFFKNKVIDNKMEFIVQKQLMNNINLSNDIQTLGVFRIKTFKCNNMIKLHCIKYYMPIKDTITSQGSNKKMLFFENNKVTYVKNLQTGDFEDISNYVVFNNINIDIAINLCLDAHNMIGSECFYIGWDVIYSNNTFHILEANTPCGISSIEQKEPIENTMFGQSLIELVGRMSIKG
jgi:hypothetical protein